MNHLRVTAVHCATEILRSDGTLAVVRDTGATEILRSDGAPAVVRPSRHRRKWPYRRWDAKSSHEANKQAEIDDMQQHVG